MENFDYEKAYKAVLQTATQWIKDGCTDKEKICLECVFPELCESEDERIRKVIHKLLLGMREEIFTSQDDIVTKDKALAWLEKQKEPKEYHPLEDYSRGYNAGYYHGITDSEQKSAWSEEDEKEYNYIMSYLDTAPKGKQNHAAKWLKKRRPCPSWKPTQEQMRGLKYFLDYHRPQRNAGTTAWKEFDSVDSLYNDLLKLK